MSNFRFFLFLSLFTLSTLQSKSNPSDPMVEQEMDPNYLAETPMYDIMLAFYREYAFEYQRLNDMEFDEETFFNAYESVQLDIVTNTDDDYPNLTLTGPLEFEEDTQSSVVIRIREVEITNSMEDKNEDDFILVNSIDFGEQPTGYKVEILSTGDQEQLANDMYPLFEGVQRSHYVEPQGEEDELEEELVTDFSYDITGARDGDKVVVSKESVNMFSMKYNVLMYMNNDESENTTPMYQDDQSEEHKSEKSKNSDVGFNDENTFDQMNKMIKSKDFEDHEVVDSSPSKQKKKKLVILV